MLGGALLSLLTLLANVGLMAMSGWFIAAMAVAGVAGVSMNYFTPAAVIRACAIVRTAGRYGERLLTHEATLRLLTELRVWFYTRLEPLAPAGLAGYRSGDLLSRVRADIDTLDNFYLRLLLPGLVALLASLLFVLALLLFDPWLALIEALTLLAAGLLLPWLVRVGVGSAGQRITEGKAALRSQLVTDLQGMGELLIDGAAARRARELARLSHQIAREQRHLSHLSGLSQGAIGLFANLCMWLIMLTGIPLIGAGEMPPVQLSMLALFALASFEAVAPLPLAFLSLDETLGAARRIFTIAHAGPAIQEPEQEPPMGDHPGVAFAGVSLSYRPEAPLVLRRIDLQLPPGRRLALVGPSGSGKSSLLKLLLKFYLPSQGEIRFDGRPLRDYRGETIRQRIAVVAQQNHLFNTSIRENLLLARPDASQTDLERACAIAEIDTFIQAQPQGYETLVGETGVRLCGGQARRLAIARALLKEAPILALDEPTEGLDPETARRVMENLLAWLGPRSLLLITHRPHGLEAMHQILMLEDGEVREQGDHQGLISRQGDYFQFFHQNLWLD